MFVFQGFAMAIQIVMEVRTSQKTNVRPKVELVLAIYSHVTTATVFHGFTFVMATMIVWIILTKMKTGNVRPANVILTLSSLVMPIANGAELFALKKIGFAMVIQTVLMVLMRIKPKLLTVMSLWRNVHRISSSKYSLIFNTSKSFSSCDLTGKIECVNRFPVRGQIFSIFLVKTQHFYFSRTNARNFSRQNTAF